MTRSRTRSPARSPAPCAPPPRARASPQAHRLPGREAGRRPGSGGEAGPPIDPDPRAPLFSTPLTEYFAVPKGPLTRPYMTVAAIVDRRTEALLRYEWRQVTNFGPDNWAKMLDTYRPSMLFVESVAPGPRQGNGGRWLASMAGEDRALRDLVEACKKRGIKTVYWHSGGSLGKAVPVAELFDLVLATTEQRAREWRAALRHDRVAVLPHSVQPRVHNTFRAEGGRTQDVATLGTAEGGNPLPAQGDDKTSYDDFLTAVRKVGVVVAGPDANDREIAEIEACGTPVVATGAAELAADPRERDRRAHLAWRATVPVTARLQPVFEAVGLADVRNTQVVSALVAVRDQMELDQAMTQIIGQRRRPDQLVIVAEGVDAAVVEKTARQAVSAREEGYNAGVLPELVVRTLPMSTWGAALAHALLLADGDYVAVIDPRDLYGEHYLADSLRRFSEVETEIVGKARVLRPRRRGDPAAPARRRISLPARTRRRHDRVPPVGAGRAGDRRPQRGVGRDADAPVPLGRDQGLLGRPLLLRVRARPRGGPPVRLSSSGGVRPRRSPRLDLGWPTPPMMGCPSPDPPATTSAATTVMLSGPPPRLARSTRVVTSWSRSATEVSISCSVSGVTTPARPSEQSR